MEKPKPVAFLCCKLNFYFHIHLWFLQALKQDNKRICSNVQLVSHFNFSQSNVALDANTNHSNLPVAHLSPCALKYPKSYFVFTICYPLRIRPDHGKRMLAVHLIKAHHTLILMLLAH